jgi:GNAT superfamily N-acetyltransferase
MSERVQARLIAMSSLQEFGPIPTPTITAHVAAGTAFVLDAAGEFVGSTFAECADSPVTPDLPRILEAVHLADAAAPVWWLQKLMVTPELQANGLGHVLIEGVMTRVAERGAATLGLDCWAGNTKLRAFYARAGFRLHGEFRGEGYDVAVFVWQPDPGR